MRLRHVYLAAGVALLAAPAAAHAGPWHVRTLGTHDPTFLRAVDALPDGTSVIVDQRNLPRQVHHNNLELRVGRDNVLIDHTPHNFDDVHVGHDAHGGLLVAWARVASGRGPRQVYVWTREGGTRQLTSGAHSTSLFDLSVAPDGTAVLGLWSAGQVQVVRRGPGGTFGAVETLSSAANPGFPVVGAGPGGRTVVVWPEGAKLVGRAAEKGGFFGPEISIQLPPPFTGDRISSVTPLLAMTPGGRAIVVTRTRLVAAPVPRVVGYRVEGFTWAPDAQLPTGARQLSQSDWAGPPNLVARGETGYVVWTESASSKRRPTALRSLRWSPQGPSLVTTYAPARDLGSRFTRPVIQPLPGVAARVYYQPSGTGRWYTVQLDDHGRAHGASSVSGPREGGDGQAALTRRGSLLAWTTELGRRNSGWRVRIARP